MIARNNSYQPGCSHTWVLTLRLDPKKENIMKWFYYASEKAADDLFEMADASMNTFEILMQAIAVTAAQQAADMLE